MSDQIICPKCGVEIEVSAALSQQLRDQLQEETCFNTANMPLEAEHFATRWFTFEGIDARW